MKRWSAYTTASALLALLILAAYWPLAQEQVAMPSPPAALDYTAPDAFKGIGLRVDPPAALAGLLPPGWMITNIPGHEALSGGLLRLPGKARGQELRLGQYDWGWAMKCVPGEEPWGNIFEVYVPKIFSVAPQNNALHPFLGVRDRKDCAEVSVKMDSDSRWGEIGVGNLEGDYPGCFYHFQSGLRFIVDSGGEYIRALNISSNANVGVGVEEPRAKLDVDGEVRAQQYQASDGSPGITTNILIGRTLLIFKDGLLSGCRTVEILR